MFVFGVIRSMRVRASAARTWFARESDPFLVAVSLVTLLLIFVPDVVLFAPDAIFGKD